MLQRIQSIWTLIAILAEILLSITGQDVDVFGNLPVVLGGVVVLILILGFSIFSYNNRKRQMLLNKIGIIINVLLIGVLVYWLLNVSGGISFPEKGIEPIFPAVAVLCLILANTNIHKDEKLVKSIDRLR